MRKVDDIDKWDFLKEILIEKGYIPWQYQYGTDCPEGFHVWFWKANRPVYEVVTYNKLIEKDIINTSWRKNLKGDESN